MNPKKSIDFKKNTSPKNNITSPKSIKSNKSKSPPPKNVSSTNAN